jgi:hypothetical protein
MHPSYLGFHPSFLSLHGFQLFLQRLDFALALFGQALVPVAFCVPFSAVYVAHCVECCVVS